MRERGIKDSYVLECVEIPDYCVNSRGIFESHRKIEGKLLRVVWTRQDKFIKVISVMWR